MTQLVPSSGRMYRALFPGTPDSFGIKGSGVCYCRGRDKADVHAVCLRILVDGRSNGRKLCTGGLPILGKQVLEKIVNVSISR